MSINSEELKSVVKESIKEILDTKEPKLTLTIDDASKLSGIGRNKMIELTYSPDFPAFKVGSKTLINRDRFIGWLNKISEQKQTI